MKKENDKNLNTHHHLDKAKKNKDDEFYTKYEDIENELSKHKEVFKNKIIYLNCDSEESEFLNYFKNNFDEFKIKKVIATSYSEFEKTYKIEISKNSYKKTELKGNGDFRSKECIDILKECDMVVTNPPFSIKKDFLDLMEKYNKKFFIILPFLTSTTTYFLEKIINGEYKVSLFSNIIFKNGKTVKIIWTTNIKEVDFEKKVFKPIMKYDPKIHMETDNYKAIFIRKYKEIPYDYYGLILAPLSYIDFFDYDTFDLLGIDENIKKKYPFYIKNKNLNFTAPYVNGKRMFKRLLIKRKDVILNENPNEKNALF